ncbi:hypothetical protein J6590_070855 [Homalodisca vitripennis]|nr:hypothetical protein J6590_070855 [Homalodisca vitripennis]
MTPRASKADFGTQCHFPASCMDEQCVNGLADINNLRTTVEVLKAELRTLRGTRCGKCGGGGWWIRVDGAAKVETKIKIINDRNSSGERIQLRGRTLINPFLHQKHHGDSHGRDIAELVQSMAGSKTDATPPPGSCYVIIAGTNDLAARHQNNIYRYLELCITAKLKTAKVIVSTLPHRHDLPTDHPINKETELVNAYIEELCARHSGAVVLDVNLIGRDAFTRHGMHLKTKSKRLLAKHRIHCMQDLGHIPGAAPSSPPIDNRRQSSASRQSSSAGVTEPRTLPYETFADAVKTTKNIVKKNKNVPPLKTTTVT